MTSRGCGAALGLRRLPSCSSPTNSTTRWSKQALFRPMARRPNLVARKQLPRRPSLEDAVALLRQRFGGRLAPPLEGLAYRFTIWLPILAQGKPVFSKAHQGLLVELFFDCFGGFTQSRVEGFPPWSGSWLPPGADEPIVDHHIQLIVYALQDTEALTCF